MEFKLEFQDPPPPKGVWVRRLEPLVERPHEYALIAQGSYNSIAQTAQNLRKKYRIPPGKWTFTVRRNDELTEENGKRWADLYAVYEGHGDD